MAALGTGAFIVGLLAGWPAAVATFRRPAGRAWGLAAFMVLTGAIVLLFAPFMLGLVSNS